jgi:hypothetical protein
VPRTRRITKLVVAGVAFLRTEPGKQVGAQALHGLAGVADRVTKGRRSEQIERLRVTVEAGLRKL